MKVGSPLVAVTLLTLVVLAGCQEQQGGGAPKLDQASSADDNSAARPTPPEDLSLDESQREYLWDLEHHSNLLSQHGLKRIGGQIKSRDAAGLRKHFADGFDGQLLGEADPLAYASPTLTARRATESTHETRAASADEFVEWLAAQGAPFQEIAGTQFGVKRIGPIKEGDVDGLWWVWCTMRIWGVDQDGQKRESSAILSLNVRRPTEANLAEPGWLVSAKVLQVADSRSPDFLFRDVTKDVGFETAELHENWGTENKLQVTGGLYSADFNRDGYADLLITDHGKNLETLYFGTADGKFQNVTVEAGLMDGTALPRTSICVAAVDLDGDGWDDLISGDGVIRRNDQGRGFSDVTGRSNFALAALLARPRLGPAITGIIPADFDRDGKLDLFLFRIGNKPTSWLAETNERYLPNQLLRNLGDWRFEDVTLDFGLQGGGRSCFSAAWFDANNDLWPDLYVINEFGDGLLYVNEQGKAFRQQDLDDQVGDFGSMGLAVGDIDNDENIDVYVAAMYSKAGSRIIGNMPDSTYAPDVMKRLRSLVDGSEMYRNLGGLRFRASGQEDQVHDAGWAWGPLLADFDNDGFLDLYATAGYMSRDRTKPDG